MKRRIEKKFGGTLSMLGIRIKVKIIVRIGFGIRVRIRVRITVRTGLRSSRKLD